jgi:hypothetical protein
MPNFHLCHVSYAPSGAKIKASGTFSLSMHVLPLGGTSTFATDAFYQSCLFALFSDKITVTENLYLSKVEQFTCTNSVLTAGNTIYLPERKDVNLHNCTLSAPAIIYLDEEDPCLQAADNTELAKYCRLNTECNFSSNLALPTLSLMAAITPPSMVSPPQPKSIKGIYDELQTHLSPHLQGHFNSYYYSGNFSLTAQDMPEVQTHWHTPLCFDLYMMSNLIAADGVAHFFNDQGQRHYPIMLKFACASVLALNNIYFNVRELYLQSSSLVSYGDIIASRMEKFTCIQSNIQAHILYLPKSERVILNHCDLSMVEVVVYADQVPYCQKDMTSYRYAALTDGHREALGADIENSVYDAIYCS